MARIPADEQKVKSASRSTAAVKARRLAKPATSAAAGEPASVATPVLARRPGRPSGSTRGPEQRSRLLDAALTLFARQGIVDTTLGEIAREAGFTPAMMHYYFKTRDQLLDVLIDERFAPLRAGLGVPFQENPDDPVAAITLLAQRLVQVASDNPWFPSLWVREVISDGGLLRQRMHERFGDTHQKASLSAIARWQKEGRLNAGLEPSLVFVTLLGMTILPLATSKLWRNDPARRNIGGEEIARHAVALLVQGIGPGKTN
ncbi:TetR/AcrR family transcriptional regulator [Burkholderia sp. R-69980]|jgi:Transcriptional regulator|uniref:TetR/AcrR family transcriptional regulator n=1 Tax=Paraburkholderia domus TaxID=2793075 RepID=UPI001912D0B4|nr:TetR/AcrR family transcriptional regulator [Paraburkholderia domus]MBK5051534.1 TetR/AcrR family transcriptional regulator [Burkholderia sp. R-70006]MBK5122901.1 TetR/AcrR family transcriptional regulator [Burkholderia sp. R-69980]MCI0148941.1 TetR family transcriptional regulator [Paraburkholderia sediminicola]CAE6788397.1 HTH-type transcriptional regulator BetI [Paraburkholderia domus]